MMFANGTLLDLLEYRSVWEIFDLIWLNFILKKGKFNLLFWTINLDDKLMLL